MTKKEILYIVDLVLVGLLVFFLSSQALAAGETHHAPVKAELLLLNHDYFFEQKKPIPYLDIQISRYLNPWEELFETLHEQAEVNKLDAQIMENNQWSDLQKGTGLAFIVAGFILFLIANEAIHRARQDHIDLT